jgi:hypothetical protein
MASKYLTIWIFAMIAMAMLINMKGVFTGDMGDANRFAAKITNTEPRCTQFSGMSYRVDCYGRGPDDGVVRYNR